MSLCVLVGICRPRLTDPFYWCNLVHVKLPKKDLTLTKSSPFVFDELELIIYVSQGLTLSTASLVIQELIALNVDDSEDKAWNEESIELSEKLKLLIIKIVST